MRRFGAPCSSGRFTAQTARTWRVFLSDDVLG